MTGRLLFLNRFYAPDVSATAQLLTDLAEELVGRGEAVTVITSRLLYDDPSGRLPASDHRDEE
jgi:colanic acid biosynthesis glycosyl transferase WcaI